MSEMAQDASLIKRLTAYLIQQMPAAEDLTISALTRIHGGASRETYSVDIVYTQADETVQTGLILRRDPVDSLIETERRIEFAALKSVEALDIPTPIPLFLEVSTGPLGAPFFIMSRIENSVASVPFRLERLTPHQEALGQQMFAHMGHIARLDVDKSALAEEVALPTPETCWSIALDYWEDQINTNARKPEAIAKAAIRHLRRHPPPPAQKLSLIHGDYRVGNFMHDEKGTITGILDWEMAHIGDPYEDIAWASDLLWSGGDVTKAAGLISWPEAIATWEAASGLTFDFQAFEWWSIFSSVKAISIWISSARAYADGANDDPVLAFSGWFTHAAHERILSARLASKYKG